MRHQFRLKGLPDAPVIEQDVKVTTQTVKDVKLQVGDTVFVQCVGTVHMVSGTGGVEVDISNLRPVKITGVKR